jgi:hypothetical protein
MPDLTSTPAVPESGANVDVDLSSIVSDVLSAADAEGVETVMADGAPETIEEITIDGNDEAAIAKELGLEAETTETPAPAAEAAHVAETPAATPEETVAAARARKILAAATEKETAARTMVETFQRDFASGLKTNPKAMLAKLGLDIDTLIDASIAEGKLPEVQAPDRVTALEERLAARENAETEAQLNRLIEEKRAAVKADPRFPTINAAGKQALVTDFMLEYHAVHKVPISWDKAATLIENDLRSLSGTPAPKPAPTPSKVPAKGPSKETKPAQQRPGSTTLANTEVRSYTPPADELLPTDPDKLLKYLVEHADF